MQPRNQVAAVPYRIGKDEKPCLLLIRTRKQKKWTFPKGDNDHGSSSESAAAEAREEAGVCGVVEPESFTSYPWKGQTIDAFLLRVEVEGLERPAAEEKRGPPQWCTQEDARRLFGEGSALADVVDTTVERISGL